MSFLNLFKNINTQKDIVGIFISPKSLIEIIQIDGKTKQIIKYAQAELEYDLVSRHIYNIQSLEAIIQRVFTDQNIPFNSSVVLSLPAIITRHLSLPDTLSEEEVKYALVSESEKNYIFKKNEPIISWKRVNNNADDHTQYVFFSAIQKEEILKIEEIFNHLGVKLLAIDSNYNSLLRGLCEIGIVEEDIKEDNLWSILLITVNSLVIMTLMGGQIIDIIEEPLALKSYNPDDIYQTLVSFSAEKIKYKNPDHLVIVSEYSEVSAQKLSEYLNITSKMSFLEVNKFNNIQYFASEDIPPEKLKLISPEVVGATLWEKSLIPVDFDFSSSLFGKRSSGFELNLFGKPLVFTPKLIEYCLIGLIGLGLVSVITTYLITASMLGAMEKTIIDVSTQLQEKKTAQVEAQKPKGPTNDVYTLYDKNSKLLQAYNSLGSIIPEKLWIDYFEISDSLTAQVKGKATSVDDIIVFYQNILETTKLTDFKITSIKVLNEGSSSSDNGVSVVSESTSKLSALPNLPSLSTSKLYEFAFGSSAPAATAAVSTPSPGVGSETMGAMPGGPSLR